MSILNIFKKKKIVEKVKVKKTNSKIWNERGFFQLTDEQVRDVNLGKGIFRTEAQKFENDIVSMVEQRELENEVKPSEFVKRFLSYGVFDKEVIERLTDTVIKKHALNVFLTSIVTEVDKKDSFTLYIEESMFVKNQLEQSYYTGVLLTELKNE